MTIDTLEEQPSLFAPALSIEIASSQDLIPPLAFTPISAPTILRINEISSIVAPPGPKPVEVFTNAAPAALDNADAITLPGGIKPMVFKDPGEYEVAGVVITGINSFHDDSEGTERGKNIIFHLIFDGLNIVHLGDLGQTKLTEEQITQIGQVDILIVPVGSIYTINGKAAAAIVSQLEPKIIIPMHYKIEGLKFELEGAEGFLKEMGVENVIPQPKLSISKDKLPEEPQVVILSKS